MGTIWLRGGIRLQVDARPASFAKLWYFKTHGIRRKFAASALVHRTVASAFCAAFIDNRQAEPGFAARAHRG
jgi:hypothetical protein